MCRVSSAERRLPRRTARPAACECRVGVGCREVAHQADDVAHRGQLREPEAPHAGVELHVHALRRPATRRQPTASSSLASRASRDVVEPGPCRGSARRRARVGARVPLRASRHTTRSRRRRARALDTSTAPWPYPSALTTAQSAAPSSASRSVRTLRRSAPRSTVISLRCISRSGCSARTCAARAPARRAGRGAGRGGRRAGSAPKIAIPMTRTRAAIRGRS